MRLRTDGLVWLRVVVLVLIGMLLSGNVARAGDPLVREDFVLAAPQGFGDRQNSWAWSMQWWNGHLYVGVNRAFRCVETASLNQIAPELFPYPPSDPDLECALDPEDLPLQAEIWRWTPRGNTWERVYQAPANVPLPSGKVVARDIGYRGMTVFTEPDGTEALYVTSVSPQFVFKGLQNLPARILRSTDGVHFEPVPQDPGTALGNFPFSSFRSPVGYNGRFYVVGGTVQGSGALLESDDPARGNDTFQVASPSDMIVSTVRPYRGHLYVGLRDLINGYSIVKTDAIGEPPYIFVPVVENGGYLNAWRNPEVLNMVVFDGRLYVGGNGLVLGPLGVIGPAELIRINPDDSWDVVVGYPRQTPDGWKFPLSGFSGGFDNFLNGHMWRMVVYDGRLYVGTFDSSTSFKDDPEVAPIVEPLMGFDLYCTADGVNFTPITTDGFGDKFSFGARSLAATPYGLFLGTANPYYGLQIWRAAGHTAYVPAVISGFPTGQPRTGE